MPDVQCITRWISIGSHLPKYSVVNQAAKTSSSYRNRIKYTIYHLRLSWFHLKFVSSILLIRQVGLLLVKLLLHIYFNNQNVLVQIYIPYKKSVYRLYFWKILNYINVFTVSNYRSNFVRIVACLLVDLLTWLVWVPIICFTAVVQRISKLIPGKLNSTSSLNKN